MAISNCGIEQKMKILTLNTSEFINGIFPAENSTTKS